MVKALSDSLRINPAICKILVQRNIKTFEEAKSYYRPQLSDLHDPWLMKDMRTAVLRIQSALN
ncbi:MAG TPA: single-stranded-DNA-specific exonuclease RecJ, partial [Chitinophagaceae bacterium]